MTPDEIKALREKHNPIFHSEFPKRGFCDCCRDHYPCDVIRALDELEQALDIRSIINNYLNSPIYTNEDYDL